MLHPSSARKRSDDNLMKEAEKVRVHTKYSKTEGVFIKIVQYSERESSHKDQGGSHQDSLIQ